MPVLKYVGRARAIEVDAVGVTVARGETAEFSDEIAKSLLRQRGQWEKATVKKSTTSSNKNEEAD